MQVALDDVVKRRHDPFSKESIRDTGIGQVMLRRLGRQERFGANDNGAAGLVGPLRWGLLNGKKEGWSGVAARGAAELS